MNPNSQGFSPGSQHGGRTFEEDPRYRRKSFNISYLRLAFFRGWVAEIRNGRAGGVDCPVNSVVRDANTSWAIDHRGEL